MKAIEEAQRGVTTIMVLPWYCQYGNAKTKAILPEKKLKRQFFDFRSPISGRIANMHVVFICIRPSKTSTHEYFVA